MVDPGEKVTSTLRREFAEEALNDLEMAPTEKEGIRERLDALFAHGQEVEILIYFILLLMLAFE
jgi:hypothetical protein